MMKCICGKELNGKQRFCSQKCQKADYRAKSDISANMDKQTPSVELDMSDELVQTRTNIPPENVRIEPELVQDTTRTNELVQALTIDDIIKMPLAQAKAILRSWAEGAGNVKQYLLGNLAIEYDVTKHNYPVSHIIPRPKTMQGAI